MAKEKNKLKPVDAPLFGYWRALLMSFYSKRLYIDVGKRWPGVGFRYFCLLIALWSIPFAIKMIIDFDVLYQKQLIEPLSTIPKIYIQNGEVIFDKPMPYILKNKQNEVVLIIDTTDKITIFGNEYPFLSVLINKNKIAFRMPQLLFPGANKQSINPNKPIVQEFSAGENFVLDGKRLVSQNDFNSWKYFIQATIYPAITIIFMGLFIVLFLAFGFLGQLFARIFFSFQVTVKQSIRLLMVATTPMMLILMVLFFANLTFAGYGFLLMAILAVYFSFGVYSLKSESMRMVRS